MRIVDQGIISRRAGRNAYMPGIEPLPDGSFIAAQFTASHFTASDAKIEILRSTGGLSAWTNEGEIKGPGAAEDGWSYRGARIYHVPDGRLLLKTTRFDTGRISETFDAASDTLQQPENIILWSGDAAAPGPLPSWSTSPSTRRNSPPTAPATSSRSPPTAGCIPWRPGSPSATTARPTRRPSPSSPPTRGPPGAI